MVLVLIYKTTTPAVGILFLYGSTKALHKRKENRKITVSAKSTELPSYDSCITYKPSNTIISLALITLKIISQRTLDIQGNTGSCTISCQTLQNTVCVTTANWQGWKHLPLFKSFIKCCVICAQNKHNIKPSLREEVTAMIIHNIPSLTHLIFYFIHNLHKKTAKEKCEKKKMIYSLFIGQ